MFMLLLESIFELKFTFSMFALLLLELELLLSLFEFTFWIELITTFAATTVKLSIANTPVDPFEGGGFVGHFLMSISTP